MKIGILSDSHGRPAPMQKALELLRDAGAQHYLHCGDIGDRDMLDLLAGLPAGFVWGNCDFDRADLRRYAAQLDITCFGDAGEIELDGKIFGIMHGDDHNRMQKALDEQHYDYLLVGHTHVPRDERLGKLRIINPGALHRASVKTVALLDTLTDELRLIRIEG